MPDDSSAANPLGKVLSEQLLGRPDRFGVAYLLHFRAPSEFRFDVEVVGGVFQAERFVGGPQRETVADRTVEPPRWH